MIYRIDMQIINKWFYMNKLKLNLTKTKYLIDPELIVLHNVNCNNNSNINNKCKCGKIIKTDIINYLGLNIHKNLKWKSHINKLINRLRLFAYKRHYLKKFISKKFLQILYNSWIHSNRNYGIICWRGDFTTNIKSLNSLIAKIYKKLNCQGNDDKTFLINIREI